MENKTEACSQEFDINDDMLQVHLTFIQFAQQLDHDSYNVKRYRKRNTSHTYRNRNLQHTSVHHDSSHLIIPIPHQHQKDQSVDKTQRNTEILSSRRFSSTAGVKKRSQKIADAQPLSFLNTGRTKLPSSVVDNPSEYAAEEKELATLKWNQSFKPPGKFVQKQRQLARKGPLQNKHFQ